MAIVQGVGYDQPSFSHFTSMSFWHTAAPNSGNEYGWIGRTASALDPAGARAEHDRQHLRQPDAGGEGREARAAGVHRSDEIPARRVRAGEGGARRAGRAARTGRRRAQVRAGSHQERGAGVRSGARRLEQVQGQGQPGPAPARSGQGGGADRSRLPDAGCTTCRCATACSTRT